MGTTSTSTARCLVEALRSWDGSAAAASELRAMAGALRVRTKLDDPAERAVAKVANGRPAALASWLLERPEEARLCAPLIGATELGAWPFHAPESIRDDQVEVWAELLRTTPVVVDDRVRAFMKVLFYARPRGTWVPVSRLFAAVAVRDGALRDHLRDLVGTWLPKPWPDEWPGGKLAEPDMDATDDGPRKRRHLIHTVCTWLALGGDPEVVHGLTAERFAATPLPSGDDSDLSACLLGVRELLQAESTRPVGLEVIARLTETLGAADMAEAVLRDLADELGGLGSAARELRAPLVRRLAEPRWLQASGRFQAAALLEWSSTVRWLRDRRETVALEAARRAAGPARTALDIALGEPVEGLQGPDPVVALCTRLPVATRSWRRDTLPGTRQSTLVAELLALCDRPELADLDWPSVVRRALDGEQPVTKGTLGRVATTDIAVWITESELPLLSLLRPRSLSVDATLRLARVGDGGVARHVAVQVERMLREADSPEARVRLLWEVLRRDPPSQWFRQIRLQLRGDATPVHAVLEALEELDGARGSADDEAKLPARFAALLDAVVVVLAGPGATRDASVAQRQLSSVKADVVPLLSGGAGGGGEMDALRVALLGASGESGLVGWAAWLRAGQAVAGQAQRAKIQAQLEELHEALARLEHEAPLVPNDAHLAARAHLAAVTRALGFLDWPESCVAAPLLARVEARIAASETESRARRARCDELTAVLDGGDIDRLEALLDEDGVPASMTAELARRAHTVLLDAGRMSAAGRLRTRLAGRVALPPATAATARAAADRGDVDALVALVREDGAVEALAQVPGLLERVHGHLLAHLRLGTARLVRRRAAGRIALDHPVAYLAPLFLGVLGGTFVVLDFGRDWVALAEDGAWGRYTFTLVVALVVSYGLLFGDLASAVLASGEGFLGRLRSLARPAARVAAVFVAAWGVAFVASVPTMATLGEIASLAPPSGTDCAKAALWSALSLFLGVFLGLVLQGRRARRE